jgi:hypothetical protein
MDTHRLLATLALSLAPAAALAGMYDQPWAIAEAADKSSVRKEFPPAITQVDGRTTRNPRSSDALEPGKHIIQIRFSTGRVVQSPADEVRDVEIDAAPCTRYRIAAARTQGTEWVPKVYPEPIGECKRKFQKK